MAAWASGSQRAAAIETRTSYTGGNHVDIVRLGDVEANASNVRQPDIIDVSGRIDSSSFLILALEDNDVVTGGIGNDYIYGGNGNDVIKGGLGSDWLYGESGDDTLRGDLGSDHIEGGDGSDTIVLGQDGGVAYGDDGADTIVSLSGSGELHGGEGDDTIFVGTGYTSVDAGAGNDTVIMTGKVPTWDTSISVALGSGADTIFLAADGSFQMFDLSFDYAISDGDANDRLIWNGYELTGGTFTVFNEVTSTPENVDGCAAWLGDHGVVYLHYDPYDELLISLPDGSRVIITDFQNGDFGMTFDAERDYWNGWVDLQNNGWTGLPRANTVFLQAGLGFGAGFVDTQSWDLELVSGRFEAYQDAGPIPNPLIPSI